MISRRSCSAAVLTVLALVASLIAASAPAALAANVASSVSMSISNTNPLPGIAFTISGSVSPASANVTRTVHLMRRNPSGTYDDIGTRTSTGSYSFSTALPSGWASAAYYTYVEQRKHPTNGNNLQYANASAQLVTAADPHVPSTVTMSLSTITPLPGQGFKIAGNATPVGGGNGPRTVVLMANTSGISGDWVRYGSVVPGYADEIQTNTSDGWYHFENVTVPPGSNVVSFYVFTRQLSTNDGHLWQYASAPARTVVQDNSVDQVTAVQARTPKIVETGDRSGPEGVERAAQSGKIDYNIQSGTREIRLYSRPVGTQDPWTIVKSWTRNPGTDELWVQPLWGSLEYHTAILEPTGAWVTSPVTTIAPGPAPEIFDDFSGTSIDQTKWALRCTTIGQTDPVLLPFGDPAECGHKEDYERHSWSAVQVQQQGGGSYADLRVLRDSRPGAACDLSRCPVWSSSIASKTQIEAPTGNESVWIAARAKAQEGQRAHSSLWTVDPAGGWCGGGEVDIMEYFGDARKSGQMQHQVRYKDNVGYPQSGSNTVRCADGVHPVDDDLPATDDWELVPPPPGTSWSAEWHIYALRWRAGRYDFFVDGEAVHDSTVHVNQGRMQLILSQLVDDDENGRYAYDTDPHSFKVDWVQVWRYP